MRRRMPLHMLFAVLLALFVPISAAAQSENGGGSTISVPGFGSASAPADSATIQLVVGETTFGPPEPPDPAATPGAEEREAVAPVVDALVRQGIAEDEIVVIVGPYVSDTISIGGPATAIVRFTVDDPTTEVITGLVDASTVGASQERLVIGRVTVIYHAEDCTSLEREAFESAIADGEARADLQSELLGVERGELVASRDTTYGIESALTITSSLGQDGSCTPVDTDTLLLSGFTGVTFDPTAEPQVQVRTQVELTFEITPSTGATPAA